jgi:hypothetical protein
VVKNYNKRVHRSIGKAPDDVKDVDEAELWFKMKHDAMKSQPPPKNFNFRIGDHVRLKLPKELYSKDFDEKFSTHVYSIASRLTPFNINRYKVKDFDNKLLPQTYSESELIKVIVNDNTKYRIEKVIRKKLINGSIHGLIKWFDITKTLILGYP